VSETDLTDDIARARRLTEGVLHDLELTALGWRVRSVGPPAKDLAVPPLLHPFLTTELLVEVGPNGKPKLTIHVYFSLVVPHWHACVVTADQLQDQVLEWNHGRPVPACPGHQHPAMARPIDSRPTWVCPHDDQHFQRAITGS